MKNIREYTVFISSPADVARERQVIEQSITNFKKYLTDDSVAYNIIDMSKIPTSFAGMTAQEHINQYADQADIYIGMMGLRFGTQTIEYGSGTEEEFRRAYERKIQGENLSVGFLFKDSQISINATDDAVDQFNKVRAFKKEVGTFGFYHEFSNDDQLTESVIGILKKHYSDITKSDSKDKYQHEMFVEVPSLDAFKIDDQFFKDFLNSNGAELSNNQKITLQLTDLYTPLDLKILDYNKSLDDNSDVLVNVDTLKFGKDNLPSKIILAGHEGTGKTALTKMTFLDYHKRGYVPVLIKGAELKFGHLNDIGKLVDKCFVEQYSSDALARYKDLPDNKKVIVIDSYEDSPLNDKYKVSALSTISETYSQVLVTIDPALLFNLHMSSPEGFSNLTDYQMYEIEDMGHKLRDSLIQKWIKAGRDTCLSNEDLFTLAEKYRGIVDAVLGTNFAPKRPLTVLVLLQAAEGGMSNNLTKQGLVRYYEYLIDSTILNQVPSDRIDLYYSFLPEMAYAIYKKEGRSISNEDITSLIKVFSEERGIHEDELTSVRSNLLFMDIVTETKNEYKFKHSFTYYFFLSKYFSDRINISDAIKAEVRDICDTLHIKESANIIVFLSYHSNNPLILENVLRVADSLFPNVTPFSFDSSAMQSLNTLVAEIPKAIVKNDAIKQREIVLEKHDKSERVRQTTTDKDIDKAELDAMSYTAHANLAYRSTEILGQLLKNHWSSFSGEQKKLIYTKAIGLSMRCLNVWVEQFADSKDELAEYALNRIIEEKGAQAINKKDKIEAQARKLLFSFASHVVFCFIKATSNFIGADQLKKTYEDVLKENPNRTLSMIDVSTKMDFFQQFPIKELEQVSEEFNKHHMGMAILRGLVRHRLYMRPIDDFKMKQQICQCVGLSLVEQFNIKKKAIA